MTVAVDLIAALTVWALVVPEAIAYASLAACREKSGLYVSLTYAIFGSSR
jgi:MFS superfamily sulfate permease-like transporter